MKWFDNIALTLVIVGALNWLLVGGSTWWPTFSETCPCYPVSSTHWSAFAASI